MNREWNFNDSMRRTQNLSGGFSLVELVIALAVIGILAGISIPQIITVKRVMRFKGITREMTALIRFTRQQAMSQRQVFRFRYDHRTKQVVIIDNEELGTAANPLANNPANDRIVKTVSFSGPSLLDSEMVWGRPPGAPATLSDGTVATALVNNQLEFSFQPDGTVLDANGALASRALFFYHSLYPDETAMAISVIGAGGRVKLWRYNRNANLYID